MGSIYREGTTPLDLATFSACPEDVQGYYAAKPKGEKARRLRRSRDLPRHGPGEAFVKGPIPLTWLRLAATCGPRSEAVALLLWYAAGWQKSNPVRLTPSVLDELRVSPKTAKRVLLRMARLGLVDTEFRRGRSPRVTIKSPDDNPAA